MTDNVPLRCCRDKQPVIETENHRPDHAVFKGAIPEAEYSSATVMVPGVGAFDGAGRDRTGAAEQPLAGCWPHGYWRVTPPHGDTRTESDTRLWRLVDRGEEAADARRNRVSTDRSTAEINDDAGRDS
ncbi:MAG: hypothetical protein CMP08_09080 [Xanthomonadales bacterium]|nr:hypothetical protein [Xanthomonadales bacterium]|tara:strand:+ start:136 stop:519 length:384 start_codon:yes stop_codon:yes gene_type:complete